MTNFQFSYESIDLFFFRVGVKALEGDGGEPKTSDCPLACPQGEQTYHQDDFYISSNSNV